MAHSSKKKSRKRDRSSRDGGERKETKKTKRRRSDTFTDDEDEADEEGTFKVEKILASKKDRGQVTYRVRWKGYGPNDDTWEPLANVASTGQVDRFIRRERAKNLRRDTPGVAVIQYEDGEQEVVDMRREKFREYDSESSDSDSDDESVVEVYGRDFNIIKEGKSIELMWPHADLGFECKVLSWVPVDEGARAKEAEDTIQPRKEKHTREPVSSKSTSKDSTKKKSKHAEKSQSKERGSMKDSTQSTTQNVSKDEPSVRKEKKSKKRSERDEIREDDEIRRKRLEKDSSRRSREKQASEDETMPKKNTKKQHTDDKIRIREKTAKDDTAIPKKTKSITTTTQPKENPKRDQSSASLGGKEASAGTMPKNSATKSMSRDKTNNHSKHSNGVAGGNASKQYTSQETPEYAKPVTDSNPETRKRLDHKKKSGKANRKNDGNDGESSDLSEESLHWTEKPLKKRTGHGIPLFNEPEDDFDSSDDEEEEEEDDEDEDDQYELDGDDARLRMSAEQLWSMKLQRTAEMMENNSDSS